MSDAPLEESTIAQSVFEGLFVHVLHPTGQFAEDLRRTGFDLTKQEPTYPARVWKECLAVAAQHEYPGAPREQALQNLGRRFVAGYFQTIIGRVAAVLLPVLGPRGLVRRLPKFFKSGSPGSIVEITEVAPTHFRVRIQNRHGNPEFNSGIVLGMLEEAGVKGVVTMGQVTVVGGEFDIQW